MDMQNSDHQYKLIIFDFDGTLADSFSWFAENINKAAGKFNFCKVNNEDHERLRSLDTRGILKNLGIPLWKVPFIARYMRGLMASELSYIKLFTGVEDLIKQVTDKKVSIAIVSSNSHGNVVKILGEHSKYVNFFECGVSLFGKRSRFQKILKRARIQSHEVLCIGDEVRDILAAKEAGLHCGSVAWGYGEVCILQEQRPDHIFHSIEDILSLL